MQRLLSLLLLLPLLALTACDKPHSSDPMEKEDKSAHEVMEKGVEEKAMEKAEDPVAEVEVKEEMTSKALYEAYSAEVADGQKTVVFFHAPWCPTCVKWDKKVSEGLGDLPDNAIILKADYDSEEDLRKKYGVSKQSSAVFINADGTVDRVVGDPSVDELKTFFES